MLHKVSWHSGPVKLTHKLTAMFSNWFLTVDVKTEDVPASRCVEEKDHSQRHMKFCHYFQGPRGLEGWSKSLRGERRPGLEASVSIAAWVL